MRHPGRAALLGLVLAASAAAAGAGPAAGQDAPGVDVLITPASVQLGGEPVDVTIAIQGAPPLRGFEVVLTYDADAVAVTGAAPGDLLAASGATVGHSVPAPGRVRLFAAVATDDEALRPSGTGGLARVTLAPLAESGVWDVGLTDVQLVAAGAGDGIEAVDVARVDGARIEIVLAPDADQLEATAAAAAAFAEAAASAPGVGDTIGRAFRDLGGRLTADESNAGPILLWLGLLAAGALVALGAWWLGREDEAAGLSR